MLNRDPIEYAKEVFNAIRKAESLSAYEGFFDEDMRNDYDKIDDEVDDALKGLAKAKLDLSALSENDQTHDEVKQELLILIKEKKTQFYGQNHYPHAYNLLNNFSAITLSQTLFTDAGPNT